MGMGRGKGHGAAVHCRWGQRGRWARGAGGGTSGGEPVEEEVALQEVSLWRRRCHLSGQCRAPGSSTQQGQRTECHFVVPHGPGSLCPSVGILSYHRSYVTRTGLLTLWDTQALTLSHLTCVSCVSVRTLLHSIAWLQSTSVSLPPCTSSRPRCSLGGSTARSPWCLHMSCFRADEPGRAAEPGCRWAGGWQLDPFPAVLATAPAGFHCKPESCWTQKVDPFKKFWIILTLSVLTDSCS